MHESREHQNMLRYSIETLLKSETLQTRQYGFKVARIIPEDLISTEEFFVQIPAPARPKRAVYSDAYDDKENIPIGKMAKMEPNSVSESDKRNVIAARRILLQREEELGQMIDLYKNERALRTTVSKIHK